jgi:hypothetical protein
MMERTMRAIGMISGLRQKSSSLSFQGLIPWLVAWGLVNNLLWQETIFCTAGVFIDQSSRNSTFNVVAYQGSHRKILEK